MVKRILSALVAMVIGISIIAIDNVWLYTVAVSFFGTVGVWELIRAVKCKEFKLLTATCLLISCAAPPILILGKTVDTALFGFIRPVYAGFAIALFAIMLTKHKRIKFEHITMCGSAALLIPASLSCIILFRYEAAPNDVLGTFFVVYLLFCAWLGDSGAYFVGTFLGKHKLCPQVSPKKTVEGFIGGIITVGICVFVEALIFNMFFLEGRQINYLVIVPVGMVASIFGVLGDLSASVIKREFGVKDFGTIMPGHGGVLDRFDSVLFVAPFVFIIFKYFSPIVV